MASSAQHMPSYYTKAHFDRIISEIEQTFHKLISLLISRKDHLVRKVLQFREDFHSKEASRAAVLEELDKTHTHMQQLNVKLNEIVPVHEQAGLVYQQAKRKHSIPTTLPSLSFFCPSLPALQSQIRRFGEVRESLVPDYSQKIDPVLTAGKRGKGKGELDATGLALDEQNQKLYVADFNNNRVQVLSIQGEFISIIGEDVLKFPWGIRVTESNVFVTDRNSHKLFQFCKETHKLSKTAGGWGMNEGQLFHPQGFTVDRNGHLFIADTGNHRVSIFSSKLEFRSHLGVGTLKYPQDVQLTPEKVLVLDKSLKCVHFFSRGGNHISSCISQGGGQDCLVFHPSFFCLDAEHNFVISDCDHHNVKIVSNSGELLHTIGKKGKGKGAFECPFGIALSNSGNIFVLSDNSEYCLQVF